MSNELFRVVRKLNDIIIKLMVVYDMKTLNAKEFIALFMKTFEQTKGKHLAESQSRAYWYHLSFMKVRVGWIHETNCSTSNRV